MLEVATATEPENVTISSSLQKSDSVSTVYKALVTAFIARRHVQILVQSRQVFVDENLFSFKFPPIHHHLELDPEALEFGDHRAVSAVLWTSNAMSSINLFWVDFDAQLLVAEIDDLVVAVLSVAIFKASDSNITSPGILLVVITFLLYLGELALESIDLLLERLRSSFNSIVNCAG